MNRLLLAAFCCLCLWACNNAPNKTDQPAKATMPTGPAHSELNETLTAESVDLLHQYYTLKDALVAGDAGAADIATARAKDIATSLKTGIATNATDTATQTRFNALDTLQEGLSHILAYKDESCEVKRVHFEQVSNGMMRFVKSIALKDNTIYIQYCPMALNDKGAHWLSSSAEIRNPYFGKKMLECGEVLETIQ